MDILTRAAPDALARIRRFFDAENAFCRAAPEDADISVMLAELDPDVVIEIPGSLPHGGVWRGHDGFVRLFELVPQRWERCEVVSDAADWHQIDDGRVMTEGTLKARWEESGDDVLMRVVSLFTFSERGVSHLAHFYEDTAAIMPGR